MKDIKNNYLVWAMDENRVVGKDNKIPWSIPEDLRHLKNITQHRHVLMGHETYKSMKSYYKTKPFPHKKTYVATRQDITYDNVVVVNDLLKFVKEFNEDLYIIGGPEIFKLILDNNLDDYLFITYILDRYDGDSYMPSIDLSKYDLIAKSHSDGLIFTCYKRRDNNG